MQISLTVKDILWAAAAAFFITWFILNIVRFIRILTGRRAEDGTNSRELGRILQKCYSLFPKDIVQFNGKTFKRGMNVRVTTVTHKTFEGELIGLNSENMLCVLTKRYIVAHGLDEIEEMSQLDNT